MKVAETTEPTKPKRGRPPKSRPVDITQDEDKYINSRAPASKTLHLPDLPNGRNAKFPQIVKWWQSLTADELSHLVIYWYRKWPTWDAKRFDPKAVTNIGMSTGPCPFTVDGWERELLQMFGSGDYAMAINDDSVSRWYVLVKGPRDFDNYPPLMDTKLIMMDDPANKSYIDWLRHRGRLEGIDTKETENDMAVNEALNRTLDMNERLAERVIDLSTQATTRPEPPAVDTTAQLAGMEMIQRAGDKALDIAMRSADRMAEMTQRSNDPLELVKTFTEMANATRGGNGTEAIITMMQSQREADARREAALREELADNRKMLFELLTDRRERRETGEEGEVSGLLKLVRQTNEIKEALGIKPSAGGDGDEDGEKTGGKKNSSFTTTMMDLFARNAPTIMQNLTAISGNLLAAVIAAKGGQIPGAVPGAPGVQQVNNPQIPAQPQTPGNPATPFLNQLTPTFLYHMNTDGLNGFTFGQWLIDSGPQPLWPQPNTTGRMIFDFMKESGKDAVVEVLKTHPPLWDVAGQTPKKLEQFIDEMLKADEDQPEGE